MNLSASKIKLTFKDWALIGVSSLFVLSLLANFIQYHYTSSAKNEVVQKDGVIKSTIKDLKRRTDSGGSEHVTFNPKTNTITTDLAKYSKTLDTVANRIGENKSAITDYTKVSVTVSDKNLQAKINVDSVTKRKTATFKDNTFDLRYNYPFGADSVGTFDPSANIDLDYVNYRKRAWFLAAMKGYTDVFSPDKRVKIRGVDRLVIEQPEPMYGLRLRGSASYNTYSKGLSVGPEAAFDIGKNQIRANYYYNFAQQRWTWSFTLTRDFLRF